MRGAHLEMAQPAQLGAGNFVDADLVGLEVQRNLHARHDILLQPQFADEEVVDHVPGMHDQLDLLAGGDFQRSADDIVLGCRVFLVKAERIAAGIVDQFEIGAAELAVGSGIAETPGELFGHHFDRDGVGRRLRRSARRPRSWFPSAPGR